LQRSIDLKKKNKRKNLPVNDEDESMQVDSICNSQNYSPDTEDKTVRDKIAKKSKEVEHSSKETVNNVAGEMDEENKTDSEELAAFTILGEQKFEELQAIEMILPYWLANPEILDSKLSAGSPVAELNYIIDILKKNLNTLKVKNMFPVQEKLIPWILNVNKKPIPFRPKDVCVSASTGSGKTLAYAVPIVQHLIETKVESRVTALVMLPVFELATQVAMVFEKLCNNLKIRSLLLSKHRDFTSEQNMVVEKTLDGKTNSKVDIIISTGGRLVEHLFYTEGFDLKSLKFLVIDEADHAMSQVHNDWYHHLIQHLGVIDELQSNRLSYRDLISLVKEDGSFRLPQKLLFSATLSQDPEKISTFNLFQPKLYTTTDNKEDLLKYQDRKRQEEQRGTFIGKFTTPAELKEFYAITEYKLKPLTLYALIKKNNWRKFLCFTNTIETSHRLSFVLQMLFDKELAIEELSSLLPVKIRQKMLQKFSCGDVNGLVCTDALARGIDVPKVDVVISYDFPKHIKTYIHRVGRTARGGNEGSAVTIIAPDQIKYFERMIQMANKQKVQEIKPDRQIEEENAFNFANAQKKLRKAVEMEEKERKNATKSSGLSLFEKLQKQIKPVETSSEIVPESWKPENITANEQGSIKKAQGKKNNKVKK
jgi:ATP-dependent RNA helicase DDX51/DBP6